MVLDYITCYVDISDSNPKAHVGRMLDMFVEMYEE